MTTIWSLCLVNKAMPCSHLIKSFAAQPRVTSDSFSIFLYVYYSFNLTTPIIKIELMEPKVIKFKTEHLLFQKTSGFIAKVFLSWTRLCLISTPRGYIFFNFILFSLFIHFEAVILLLLSAIAESPLRRADEATCLWMVLHCTVWWRAALFLLAMAVNSLHVPFSLHVFPPLPSFFFMFSPNSLPEVSCTLYQYPTQPLDGPTAMTYPG